MFLFVVLISCLFMFLFYLFYFTLIKVLDTLESKKRKQSKNNTNDSENSGEVIGLFGYIKIVWDAWLWVHGGDDPAK